MELGELGADYLPLDLRPSGGEGETRHTMELLGSKPPKNTKLTEILSEGEQRVVALAGFLAELAVAQHGCPIVLDDPVSSLDHCFRDKIAQRLAKEATKRQVVIFTHDIAFLVELERTMGEIGGFFHAETVRRDGITPGKCIKDLPWHAASVGKRISFMNDELNGFRGLYKTNLQEYNRKAAELYGLLRETWEAAIEELVLNNTVRRHSANVETKRLKAVSVETDDYKAIDVNMSKCSAWMCGHDKSKALSISRPAPQDIQNDIKTLDEFAKSIRNRNDSTQKSRDVALKPKAPEIG